MKQTSTLLSIKEASKWASDFLERDISESNISYLIQYGKIKKCVQQNNGNFVHINVNDLKQYYDSRCGKREIAWKKHLGNDLNWMLSFDNLREKDTTKHVHRLHPYKGKFIPQLVEYFIGPHTDDFKKETYFEFGDILLDPFCGSGTMLVQALEMGMHSVGVDVSSFNCIITESKIQCYDFDLLEAEIERIRNALIDFEADHRISDFEANLAEEIAIFNKKYFPSPEFKFEIENKEIKESSYGAKRETQFLKKYNALIDKHNIPLKQKEANNFLDKWYIQNVRDEIDFVFEQIKKTKDTKTKKILAVILSRTIRSCRATTHSDLATLKEPQIETYYCWKHKKICKPLFSIKGWFDRYAKDTIARLREFSCLRQNGYFAVIPRDSRTVDIFTEVKKRNAELYNVLKKNKFRGIFSSPPYVGQIDYHEQHAYAYDLFGFERRDENEIGPLYKGQGVLARQSYVDGISDVLLNCKKYLAVGYDVFLVANDKYNLYPAIAEKAGMVIMNQFKRPVLNRTERDKSPYSEIIFHLKEADDRGTK